MRRRFVCDGLYGKRGTDVRSRINSEAPMGRPCGIDRILVDKDGGCVTVERDTKEAGDAVIDDRRGDRLAVGRPCRIALQVEGISHDVGVVSIGLYYV